MSVYEFRVLSSGKLIRTAEHYCFDDLDALDKAASVAAEYSVQVWQSDKRVSPAGEGIERHHARVSTLAT